MQIIDILRILLLIVILFFVLYRMWRKIHWMRQQEKNRQEVENYHSRHTSNKFGTDGVSEDSEAQQILKRATLVKELLLKGDPLLKDLLCKMSGINEADLRYLEDGDLVMRIARKITEPDLYTAKAVTEPLDLKIDTNTKVYRQRSDIPTSYIEPEQLDDVSNMYQVLPTQQMLDDDEFYAALAADELLRMQPYEQVRQKKIVYILLDGSGSMDESMPDGHPRSIWARGVVIKLLHQAVRGEAKFFLRIFDNRTMPLMEATSRREAENLISKILKTGSTGGGTNILGAMHRAVRDIQNDLGTDLGRSELLLITDGEDSNIDSVWTVKKVLGRDINLHVITIGTVSEVLKKSAVSYMEVK